MTKYYFDDWQCETETLRLTKGKQEHRLEKKVMAVLELLLRNPQSVVTTEQMFDEVWRDVVVGDNALHRAIAIIRKTLGDNPRNPNFVESIPRQGYRFKRPVETNEQISEPAGRVPVLVTANSDAGEPDSVELLRAISRLLSSYSPGLKVLRRASSEETTYLVEVRCVLLEDSSCLFQWEVLRGYSQEVISTGRQVEAHEQIANKEAQVFELIARSAATEILRHWLFNLKRLTPSMECTYWDCVMIADHYQNMESEHVADRKLFLKKAIAMEPKLPHASAAYADLMSWIVANGVTTDAKGDAQAARDHAMIALEIDANEPYTLSRCGRAYSRLGNLTHGVELSRRAAGLNATSTNLLFHADSLTFAGSAAEALEIYTMTLNGTPTGQVFQYGRIVVPMVQLGMFKEALEYAELATIHYPRDFYCWVLIANVQATLGDLTTASDSLEKAINLQPGLTIEQLVKGTVRTYGQRSPVHAENLTAGLSKLG